MPKRKYVHLVLSGTSTSGWRRLHAMWISHYSLPMPLPRRASMAVEYRFNLFCNWSIESESRPLCKMFVLNNLSENEELEFLRGCRCTAMYLENAANRSASPFCRAFWRHFDCSHPPETKQTGVERSHLDVLTILIWLDHFCSKSDLNRPTSLRSSFISSSYASIHHHH